MKLHIISRLQRLIRHRTFRLFTMVSDDVTLVKGDRSARDTHQLILKILKYARSFRCRSTVQLIENDKLQLIERLKNQKTDPTPLQHTFYAFEGEAVEGCATPWRGGILLYSIVRALCPRNIVEIGTAHGYGAAYIGSALRDIRKGKLITLEGMNVRERLSLETVDRLSISDYVTVVGGDFNISVPYAFDHAQPLDMVFNDGNKDPEMTRRQFNLSIETMKKGGFLFFDDINFDQNIIALWKKIVAHERVSLCLTFYDRWGLLRIEPQAKTHQ